MQEAKHSGKTGSQRTPAPHPALWRIPWVLKGDLGLPAPCGIEISHTFTLSVCVNRSTWMSNDLVISAPGEPGSAEEL